MSECLRTCYHEAGHALAARFRASLWHLGRVPVAEAAARELPNLPLEDALQLVHLYIERGSPNSKPVRPADQIRAYELLLAYGWGKPPAFAAIEGADPLEQDELSQEIRTLAAALRAER